MKCIVHRVREGAILPRYHTAGAAAFDLHLVEDVELAAGAVALLPTGLVFEVPEGHVLVIASRSSSPVKKGVNLANGIGIIDSDYRGPKDEVLIQVRNFRAEPVKLGASDRIAQAMILACPQVELVDAGTLDGGDAFLRAQSRGGFGTTG